MTPVRFTSEAVGTSGQQHRSGDVVLVDDRVAEILIKEGAAEAVSESEAAEARRRHGVASAPSGVSYRGA